jgi:hypothetical protein
MATNPHYPPKQQPWQNIHAYLHEVVGALQQILKAFLVSNIGEYHHHYSSVL